ncbi:unnamed protein product [Amoebophrya sp. A25]|nr:unnamed protein product [Amoebophrya sp. A25]|eukprot:GSA25T00015349001.1
MPRKPVVCCFLGFYDQSMDFGGRDPDLRQLKQMAQIMGAQCSDNWKEITHVVGGRMLYERCRNTRMRIPQFLAESFRDEKRFIESSELALSTNTRNNGTFLKSVLKPRVEERKRKMELGYALGERYIEGQMNNPNGSTQLLFDQAAAASNATDSQIAAAASSSFLGTQGIGTQGTQFGSTAMTQGGGGLHSGKNLPPTQAVLGRVAGAAFNMANPSILKQSGGAHDEQAHKHPPTAEELRPLIVNPNGRGASTAQEAIAQKAFEGLQRGLPIVSYAWLCDVYLAAKYLDFERYRMFHPLPEALVCKKKKNRQEPQLRAGEQHQQQQQQPQNASSTTTTSSTSHPSDREPPLRSVEALDQELEALSSTDTFNDMSWLTAYAADAMELRVVTENKVRLWTGSNRPRSESPERQVPNLSMLKSQSKIFRGRAFKVSPCAVLEFEQKKNIDLISFLMHELEASIVDDSETTARTMRTVTYIGVADDDPEFLRDLWPELRANSRVRIIDVSWLLSCEQQKRILPVDSFVLWDSHANSGTSGLSKDLLEAKEAENLSRKDIAKAKSGIGKDLGLAMQQAKEDEIEVVYENRLEKELMAPNGASEDLAAEKRAERKRRQKDFSDGLELKRARLEEHRGT